MMKKVYLSAPGEITVEETEIHVPTGNKVLIRVKATGICGTDVHGFLGESILARFSPSI